MNKQKLILWGAMALAGVCLAGSSLTPLRAQPTSDADTASSPTSPVSAATNSVALPARTPDPKSTAPRHQLTGAELYSINCNRCHQERYPTERTGAQWKTIMLHMQVRANIPVSQARLILQYLQENSGR
ncbi:MAG TPA: hypothetical protein VFY06_07430 [Verrucomicrobiae bacterium]|nr:hypothetical protein [Verrucomicrobiae bacterium]